MTKDYIVIGRLTNTVRLPNSKNGNPQWQLSVEGTRFTTKPDIMDAYAVTPAAHIGETVVLEIGEDGLVYGYSLLKEQLP